MEVHGRNPWLVEDLDDFYFLCCPECAYKSKDDEAFMDHAVENHPKSKASSVFGEAEQKLSKQKTVQNLPKTSKVIPKTIKIVPKTVKVMPKTENTSSVENTEESKNNETSIAVENIPKSNLESSVKRVDKKVENHPKSIAFSEIEELCNQKTVSNVEDSMLDESVEKKIAQKLNEVNKLKAILQGNAEFDDETLKNFNLKKVGKNISISQNVISEEEKTKENQLDEKVPDSFSAVESIKYDYIDGKLIRKKTSEKSKQNTVKVATIDLPKEEIGEEDQLIGMDDLNDEYTLDAYIVGKFIFW